MSKAGRKIPRLLKLLCLAAVALAAGVLWWAMRPRAPQPGLLIALLPAEPAGAAGPGATAAIGRVDLARPGRRAKPVVRGLAAVERMSVSYDGWQAVFAGRRQADGTTSIWQVSAAGSEPRPIVTDGDNHDPCYLPDGRIVYTKAVGGGRMALHTCRPDGSQQERITFGDAVDRHPAVLPDGRLVFRRRDVAGRRPGRLFELNTDGTGLELFCAPAEGATIAAGPWVVGERVLFAEQAHPAPASDQPPGQRLISVSVTDPRGDRRTLADGMAPGDSGQGQRFGSVAALPDGKALAVCYWRPHGWTVRELDGQSGLAGKPAWAAALSLPGGPEGVRPAGLALAAQRPRPLALTSVVNPSKQTGTFLCVDVYRSRLPSVARLKRGQVRTVRVRDPVGNLVAEAPVHPDGSFEVRVPADRALHLELLGTQGVLAKDQTGLWVRPNENRGCIGCHEEPDLSPENRVPAAVQQPSASVALRRSEAR